MLVVNMFGAPGTGKSTTAAYVFALLKSWGVNAELVTEFAKDKVWEESVEVFKNQAYIFGKQYFRLSRVKDKVDVAITDSPIILSPFYNTQTELGEAFDQTCFNAFNSFDNVNIFLRRVKPYNPAGRFQTEEESNQVAIDLEKFLLDNNITMRYYDGTLDSGELIAKDVFAMLKSVQN